MPPPKRQAEKGQTGYAGVARENRVALSLSVTEPLPSYDSKAQKNTHLIILVRSRHPDKVAPPPVSLWFPRALPLPISFIRRGISQNTRNKITASSDALNFCKGAGPRLYFFSLVCEGQKQCEAATAGTDSSRLTKAHSKDGQG